MALSLQKPPDKYDPTEQAQMRRAIELEDKKNLKVGVVLDSFLMKDTATGVIKKVVMTSGGFVIT